MLIKLYKNNSEPSSFPKDLTDETVVNGVCKSDLDMMNPQFVIEMEPTTLCQYNYAKVEELGKYYYIGSPEIENNHLSLVQFSEDVLETFKNEILAHPAILARSTNFYDLYLQDNNKTTQQNTNTYVFEFDRSFDEFNYVLTTSGSADNLEE